ncbi:ABC transporter permease [Dactylosporangium sp. NBC_01737]|uniref:ABC transporter permease n=1 Tax=Dactylosporangium sp. NBC_01737 TaxID=2975959 RepID=UPI002E108B9C|nr:ABC transporter permease [Dactylosporangium sp. NBC_01737]
MPPGGTAGGGTLIGTVTVLTGGDRVRADLPGALPDYVAPISIFGFLIGITAFAAVFVLTGTVTLGVRQRLRELALLRTAGATPGQLRRLLNLESLLLAGCAAVPGAPLGIVVAEAVAERFRRLGAVRRSSPSTATPWSSSPPRPPGCWSRPSRPASPGGARPASPRPRRWPRPPSSPRADGSPGSSPRSWRPAAPSPCSRSCRSAGRSGWA